MEGVMAPSSPLFIAGVPELLLLRLLATREMYGYELARAVRTVTRDAVTIGENVLYPALHALEAQRLLHSRRRSVDGRKRVYYTITKSGVRRLRDLTRRWRRVATGVQAALAGPGYE
jgi:PadR family transcriptional regulator